MPLALQVKLLRVLQEGEVRPVGATQPIPVDVRVISATHRDLDAHKATGQFREDLYYRLNVVSLKLPALADRREDIPLLATHFLRKLAERYKRPVPSLAPEAMAMLIAAPWPGNVRQLLNLLEQAVALATTTVIPATLVQTALREDASALIPFEEARKTFERDYLVRLLKITGGNVTQAAAMAKRNRTEFYKLLQRHRLEPAMFKEGKGLTAPPSPGRRAMPSGAVAAGAEQVRQDCIQWLDCLRRYAVGITRQNRCRARSSVRRIRCGGLRRGRRERSAQGQPGSRHRTAQGRSAPWPAPSWQMARRLLDTGASNRTPPEPDIMDSFSPELRPALAGRAVERRRHVGVGSVRGRCAVAVAAGRARRAGGSRERRARIVASSDAAAVRGAITPGTIPLARHLPPGGLFFALPARAGAGRTRSHRDRRLDRRVRLVAGDLDVLEAVVEDRVGGSPVEHEPGQRERRRARAGCRPAPGGSGRGGSRRRSRRNRRRRGRTAARPGGSAARTTRC